MAKGAFFGVAGKARKVKRMYIGVAGKARKVKKAYIGIGGRARLFFSSGTSAGLYFINWNVWGDKTGYYAGRADPETLAIQHSVKIGITHRFRSPHNTAGGKEKLYSLNGGTLWEIDPDTGALLRNTGISDDPLGESYYKASFAGDGTYICRSAVGRTNMSIMLTEDRIDFMDPETGAVKKTFGAHKLNPGLKTDNSSPIAGEGGPGRLCLTSYWTDSEGDGYYGYWLIDSDTLAKLATEERYANIEAERCTHHNGKLYMSHAWSGKSGYTDIFDTSFVWQKRVTHTLNTPGDLMYWTAVTS